MKRGGSVRQQASALSGKGAAGAKLGIFHNERTLPFSSLLHRIADKHVSLSEPKQARARDGRCGKLPEETVKAVRLAYKTKTISQICSEFGISKWQATDICDGLTYQWVKF